VPCRRKCTSSCCTPPGAAAQGGSVWPPACMTLSSREFAPCSLPASAAHPPVCRDNRPPHPGTVNCRAAGSPGRAPQKRPQPAPKRYCECCYNSLRGPKTPGQALGAVNIAMSRINKKPWTKIALTVLRERSSRNRRPPVSPHSPPHELYTVEIFCLRSMVYTDSISRRRVAFEDAERIPRSCGSTTLPQYAYETSKRQNTQLSAQFQQCARAANRRDYLPHPDVQVSCEAA
jgi:hypothetical protein